MNVSGSGGGGVIPSNLHMVSAPPKFGPKCFDLFRREILFWRQLYKALPDSEMLAAVGLRGSSELRGNLMDFTTIVG